MENDANNIAICYIPTSGDFLITVDVQKGEEVDSECSLKFWEYSAIDAGYRLTAQVRILDIVPMLIGLISSSFCECIVQC